MAPNLFRCNLRGAVRVCPVISRTTQCTGLLWDLNLRRGSFRSGVVRWFGGAAPWLVFPARAVCSSCCSAMGVWLASHSPIALYSRARVRGAKSWPTLLQDLHPKPHRLKVSWPGDIYLLTYFTLDAFLNTLRYCVDLWV